MPAKSQLVLGIMSGTSIDGVDYALCEVGANRVRLRDLWTAKFPGELRRRLHDAARNKATSWQVAQLHHDLGRFYAEHAVRRKQRTSPKLIGLHGQTIFHNPTEGAAATLQLGEPVYLAQTLRAPVVSNFRAADMAAGGQGAPLATMFHRTVFGRRGRHVCVNNLGGISNVTSLDRRTGKAPHMTAFDTGPANVLLDLAIRHFTEDRHSFDEDGAWASRGNVHEPLLREWLRHPFFQLPPPKSTGRELFGEPFFEKVLAQSRRLKLTRHNLLATLTALTARSIALNYKLHLWSPPDVVILTGGGAANATLRRMIAGELHQLNAGTEIQTSEDVGWPLHSIEPAAFALLAWLRTQNRPGNLPETTGAKQSVLLGQITAP